MSSSSKIVNANRLQISMLAYNIFNTYNSITADENERCECLKTCNEDGMLNDLDIDIRLNANEKQFIQEYIEFIKYKRQK